MPHDDMSFKGVVSYSHKDMEAEPENLGRLLTWLERFVGSRIGHAFRIWRDEPDLRWGEEWRDGILREINSANAFFILLSPYWLNSQECQKELNAMLRREQELGGEKCIFVAQIHELLPIHETQHANILAKLSERQAKRWQSLLDAPEHEVKATCRRAAGEIAEWLSKCGGMAAPTCCAPGKAHQAKHSGCLPVSGQPLVSGGFYFPRHDQGGVLDGCAVAHLEVVFAGWCKVTGPRATYVFGARAALLKVESDGGTLRNHLDTSSAHAEVHYVSSEQGKRFQVQAKSGPLRGNVIAPNPNDDYAPAFLVEPHSDGSKIKISGEVQVDVECVMVDWGQTSTKPCHSDLTAVEKMRRKVAQRILAEEGMTFPLKEAIFD